MQNQIFNCENCNIKCIFQPCRLHHDVNDYIKFMLLDDCTCHYLYGLLCNNCENTFYKERKEGECEIEKERQNRKIEEQKEKGNTKI